MLTPTNVLLAALITNAKSSVTSGDFAGILSGAKVGLVAAPMSPTPSSVYGDVTQPTYSGYAEQSAVFGNAYRRNEGGFATQSAQLKFAEASTITTQTIYGAYITDGGGTPKLLGVELFPDGPLPLLDALSAIYCSMQVAVGGPDWGTGRFEG